MIKTEKTDQPPALRDLVTRSIDLELFHSEGPCPISFEDGENGRLLVVTGENASGKSLYCKALSALVDKAGGYEVMHVGMGLRTTSGIQKSLMFGDENMESTGSVSMGTILTGVSTIRARKSPHYLLLDEPDIGLGESYQAAAGHYLARLGGDLPEHTHGLLVVSHARHLVAPLIEAGAMSVRVGDDRRPVREWIQVGDLPKTIEDLEALPTKSHERFLAIQDALSNRKTKD
jgi:predicted ATPase